MKGKGLKKLCSLLLIFAMVVAFIPVSDADAAVMSISSSRVIVTSGMTKTLSVKNAWKGASVKWTSTDKSIATVSSKGVVKGVKDGEAVIKCTVSKAGKKRTFKSTVSVKTTKFKASKYYISTGESKTLSLICKYSGAKYKWASSNKSVVKVTSKGKITGVSSGKATVSVKISIPKKGTRSARTLTKKVTVYVSDSVEVSTQDELDKALKNKSLDQITIKTGEKTEFTIPAGDYGKISLIVDAPNADVVNNGTFKTITIKQIASDTWTENATGNIFVIDAKAGHLVVPAGSSISELKIVNADSSFIIDVKGSAEKITIDSTSKVDINISGTVGIIEVNDKATVSVNGTSASLISVAVSDTADGTTINSNVKLDVITASNTEINLSKGAEETAVLVSSIDKSVEITNNTSSGVTVKTETGVSNTVEAGKNAAVDGSGKITESAPDTPPMGGGGIAGGGGTSGGSETPEIPDTPVYGPDIIPENLSVEKYISTYLADDEECFDRYIITNNGTKPMCIEGVLEYYDSNGYNFYNLNVFGSVVGGVGLYNPLIVRPGESRIYRVGSSFIDRRYEYSNKILNLSESYVYESELDEKVIDQISINQTETSEGFEITVTNNSEKQIGDVEATVLLFDSNGEFFVEKLITFDKVYGLGYSQTITLPYNTEVYNNETGKTEYIQAASYKLYLDGAYTVEPVNIESDIIPDNLSLQKYEPANDACSSAYVITNTGTEAMEVSGTVYEYDSNNYMVDSYYVNYLLYPGRAEKIPIYYPRGNRVAVDLSESKKYDGTLCENVIDQISINQTETSEGFEITLKNNSEKQIGDVEATVLLFDGNNKYISSRTITFDKVYGSGYSQTKVVPYQTEAYNIEKHEVEYIQADSCIILLDGAYTVETVNIESDIIPDGLSVEKYVTEFASDEGTSITPREIYKITNIETEPVRIDGLVYYYDYNNFLFEIKELSEANYSSRPSNERMALRPGESKLFYVYGSNEEYNRKVLVLSQGYINSNTLTEKVINQISLDNTETSDGLSITLTNNSGKQIDKVVAHVLLFDSDNNYLSDEHLTFDKIYGPGYSQTMSFAYPTELYNTSTGEYESVEVSSYLIYLDGAYVTE